MPTQIVFFGSSPFSTIVLNRILNTEHRIPAVVTTPDKPTGRHLKLTPNPVKIFAQKHDIPVFESARDFIENCKLKIENSVGLVAAHGRRLGPKTLAKFSGQVYVIHPSLLPRYRGPSPLQQQILDSITKTGVTLIQADLGEDTGPIVTQEKDVILTDDTTQSLGNRLFVKGADLFLSQLQKATPFKAKVQNHSLATYTKKLTRQDGFVEFEKLKNYLDLGICDLDIARMHRAFAGWPGVWTLLPDKRRLKLIALKPQILVQLEGETRQNWPIVA